MFDRYRDMNNLCDKAYNVNIGSFAYGGRASTIKSSWLSNWLIYL